MTLTEAIQAEITPYTVDDLVIEKSLTEQGLSGGDPYSLTDKKAIAKCAISILKKMLSVSNESEGGFTQAYDPEMLRRRISDLASENNLKGAEYQAGPTITDKSSVW